MKKITILMKIIFLIGIIFVFLSPNIAIATDGDELLNGVTAGGSNLINMGLKGLTARGINVTLPSFITGLAQVLWTVGCMIIIGLTIYKAVKYRVSEPSDKAKLKKDFVVWLIISVLVVAAYPIFKLIVTALDSSSYTTNIVNSLKNTTDGVTGASANTTFGLILNTAVRIIQVGATGFIIIKITIDGIKYFMSAVAAEKAEVKSSLVRDLITFAIIFGAFQLFDIIYNAFYG